MSRSMSFLINDAATESNNPQVRVTISESANGALSFSVSQEGGIVGDLRGLFFDLADKTLVGSLSTSSANTGFQQKKDAVSNLGQGTNMNGLTGSGKGFDAGIKIGTAGMGKDDIRSFEFTLTSTTRALTLDDFANVDFGVRLTSVGTLGGARNASSKIIEMTSSPINAIADASGAVLENSSATGNLFSNDTGAAGNTNTVTAWSGGADGTTLTLTTDDADALEVGSVTVGSDGQWLVSADGSDADQLSAGETLTRTYTVDVNSAGLEAGDFSTDTATFTVEIHGENDGPVAEDDSAAVAENNQAAGSVLLNDSDIDRLDTIEVNGWNGGELGAVVALANAAGATLQFNADGSYVLDASAADALSDGETITQVFTYTLADNNGATDTATLEVSVTGVNDGPVAVNDSYGEIGEDDVIVGASVSGNDSDVDRLDTHTWTLNADSFVDAEDNAAKGVLTFNTDGTWSFDAEGAYDSLNDGESVDLSFDYTMTDNHGASSTASVSFTINGEGSVPPVEPPVKPPEGKDFPVWGQDISHFTLVFEDTEGDSKPYSKKDGIDGDGYYTVKMDFDPEVRDLDLIIEDVLAALIAENEYIDADTELLGVVIKGGLQITNFYAYGDNNVNGEASDALPSGLGFTLDGTHAGEQSPSAIDLSYSDGFIY